MLNKEGGIYIPIKDMSVFLNDPIEYIAYHQDEFHITLDEKRYIDEWLAMKEGIEDKAYVEGDTYAYIDKCVDGMREQSIIPLWKRLDYMTERIAKLQNTVNDFKLAILNKARDGDSPW